MVTDLSPRMLLSRLLDRCRSLLSLQTSVTQVRNYLKERYEIAYKYQKQYINLNKMLNSKEINNKKCLGYVHFNSGDIPTLMSGP